MLKCILLTDFAQSILCINQQTVIISLHILPAGSSVPSSRILRTTFNLCVLFQTRLESYQLSAPCGRMYLYTNLDSCSDVEL